MSDRYIALYRKWRPLVFEDVVEQDHVVRSLKYSVTTGRIAHAYLFCGTRGTGKTTMAHILSRAINCLSPINGDPCNSCEICKEILSGSSTDVLEIDAASNNSVDNVREIRDEVVYAPSHAKYKVYIIDEVHMLSTGAFNALLKTLEEPPSHVVFILATTEPHKLPATILSRCQRFDFRRITVASIMDRLNKIASADGIILEQEAAKLIARLSDGALRDAISLLDQCLSQGKSRITIQDVREMVGIVNDTFLSAFAADILERNVKSILENINTIVMDGKDIVLFNSDLILYFRNLLICRVSPSSEEVPDIPGDELETMVSLAAKTTEEDIITIIKELSELEAVLKWVPNPRIMFEVTLVKLCRPLPAVSCPENNFSQEFTDKYIAAIESRLRLMETKLEAIQNNNGKSPVPENYFPAFSGNADKNDSGSADTAQTGASGQAAGPGRVVSGQKKPVKEWKEVLNYIKNMKHMALYSLLTDTMAVELENNVLGIVVDSNNNFCKTLLSKHENVVILEEAVKKVLNRDMNIRCIDMEKYHSGQKISKQDEDPLEKKARELAEKAGVPFDVIED